jgi:methionyl-tRNA formyltransferase
MKAVFFLQGFFGERISSLIAPLSPLIYTYSADSSYKFNKPFLRDGCRYINEKRFDKEKIRIAKDDIVFCGAWTKDFFHHAPHDFSVYHIHPSLLPMYRGVGAVSEQFERGVAVGGVSIYLDCGKADAGDIAYREEVRIEHNDYPEDYLNKCAAAAHRGIMKILKGDFSLIKQDDALATAAGRIRSRKTILDVNLTALSFYNSVRAYSLPYAGARLFLNGEFITVWRCSIESWSGICGRAGEIIGESDYGLEMACGEGSVILTSLEKPILEM